MANLKISELGTVSSIKDDAQMVIVQDKSNKVVTVEELVNKVNYQQNKVIAQLYSDIKHLVGDDSIKSIKGVLANHEYRLNQADNVNRMQSMSLHELTKSLNDVINKTNINTNDIKENKKAISTFNSYISYIDQKISDLTYTQDTSYAAIEKLTYNLQQLECKVDCTYSYVLSYIADASYEVSKKHDEDIQKVNDTHDEYVTYAAAYIHWGRSEYWGMIDENVELFTGDGDYDDNSSDDSNNNNSGCDNPDCGK